MEYKLFDLDKIRLFLYECVGSGGMKFHSCSIYIRIHRWISFEQRELYLADGGKVAIESIDDSSGHKLQQIGGKVNFLANSGKYVGLAYRIIHVVGLHGKAKVCAKTKIDHEIVAHKSFLDGYTVEGMEMEVL